MRTGLAIGLTVPSTNPQQLYSGLAFFHMMLAYSRSFRGVRRWWSNVSKCCHRSTITRQRTEVIRDTRSGVQPNSRCKSEYRFGYVKRAKSIQSASRRGSVIRFSAWICSGKSSRIASSSISQRVKLPYIGLRNIFSMRKYLPKVGFPFFTW